MPGKKVLCMQTMDDLRDELEATLKKIRVGDVVTGTVIDVPEDAVLVDLTIQPQKQPKIQDCI